MVIYFAASGCKTEMRSSADLRVKIYPGTKLVEKNLYRLIVHFIIYNFTEIYT